MSSSTHLSMHVVSADGAIIQPLVTTPSSRSVRQALREAIELDDSPESVTRAFDLAKSNGDGVGFAIPLADLLDGSGRVQTFPCELRMVDTETCLQLEEAVEAIHRLLAAGVEQSKITIFVAID